MFGHIFSNMGRRAASSDQERRLLSFRDFGFKEDILLGRYDYSRSRGPLLPHAHDDCMEICYLEKGQQVYETGGDVYRLKGGDVFVTFPGEVHSTADTPEEKGRLYWLIVELPGFRRSGNSAPFLSLPRKIARQLVDDLRRLPRRTFAASRSLAGHFIRLTELADQQDAYTRLRMENELRCLLLELIESSHAQERKRIHPGIDRVLRRIETELDRAWNNAAMAEAAGLCESHFKAMFKKVTGIPPADYIARKRVDHAKKLLAQTDKSVTDLAFACGFSSSQYFATVFKRYAGVTPSAFRMYSEGRPTKIGKLVSASSAIT